MKHTTQPAGYPNHYSYKEPRLRRWLNNIWIKTYLWQNVSNIFVHTFKLNLSNSIFSNNSYPNRVKLIEYSFTYSHYIIPFLIWNRFEKIWKMSQDFWTFYITSVPKDKRQCFQRAISWLQQNRWSKLLKVKVLIFNVHWIGTTTTLK